MKLSYLELYFFYKNYYLRIFKDFSNPLTTIHCEFEADWIFLLTILVGLSGHVEMVSAEALEKGLSKQLKTKI